MKKEHKRAFAILFIFIVFYTMNNNIQIVEMSMQKNPLSSIALSSALLSIRTYQPFVAIAEMAVGDGCNG